MGFAAQKVTRHPGQGGGHGDGEVKRAFNPEFLNRLDEVILFTSLADDDLLKIIHLLVDQINVNLVAKQIKIRLADDAAKYILEKTCADRSYGARPLRRALQKYIEDPLSEALIQGRSGGIGLKSESGLASPGAGTTPRELRNERIQGPLRRHALHHQPPVWHTAAPAP
jgi:ATP-dependent Clp protease ATP-binding subunit ClpA